MSLRKIQNYQDEYMRITLSSILSPETFFNETKSEGSQYLKPITYMILSQALFMAGSSLAYFVMEQPLYFMMYMGTLFFLLINFMIFGIFLVVLVTLAGRMAGGKGSLNDTLKVFFYSHSVLNFIWIFLVSFAFMDYFFLKQFGIIAFILIALFIVIGVNIFQYTIYIIVTGISVTSKITKFRAFIVLLISMLIIAALIITGSYLLDTSSHRQMQQKAAIQPEQIQSLPPTQNPGPPVITQYQGIRRINVTAFAGYAPIIDGIINDDDGWKQGWPTTVGVSGNFTITSKHDKENLYLLFQGQGPSEWKDKISIYLEQDSGNPDFNLSTGRIDRYYQGYNPDPSVFGDGHYDPGIGYSGAEHQDGSLKVSYLSNSSEWIMEWKIPLNSGDKDDIFVNKYPFHLGFSIINENEGEKGILPFYADKNEPWTWADLQIVDKRLK